MMTWIISLLTRMKKSFKYLKRSKKTRKNRMIRRMTAPKILSNALIVLR